MESRIQHLQLRIVAEEPDDAMQARAVAFARRVLERLERLLEQKAPGRVILLRHFETSWRVLDDGLALEGEDRAVAGELATCVYEQTEALLRKGGGAQGVDAECAVFVDEVEWRAWHWRARTAGDRPWCGAALDDEGAPESALLRQPPRFAASVLARLARSGDLGKALRGISEEARVALSAHVEGARDLQTDAERILANRVPTASSAATLDSWARVALDGIGAIQSVAHLSLVLAAIVRAQEEDRGHRPTASLLAALFAATREVVLRPAQVRASAMAPERECVPSAPAFEHTAFGGLAFLVGRMLELRCAEPLFAACVPEGRFVSAALRLLLAGKGADDPLPGALGGVDRVDLPALTEEPLRELASTVFAALTEAVPRRGLATFPAIRLSRVGGELLVATPEQSPWVVFAWPGKTPRDVQEGLSVFLSRWPHGAPPVTASPGLAELDRGARIRRTRAPAFPPLVSVDGASSSAAAVAQIAGASAALMALRARAELGDAIAFRDRFLAIHGTVAETNRDELVVTLPMTSIDLDVRRAGLDRDPGWVPWLRRTVRIEFDDTLVAR